ncbi:MAG TPA: TIGR04190 family B12-binding domain/radical SAM domain protein [Euryarchaeota archaeon]|nr:TIGR04190 family B12-binding domain/radical SAM domain protein [Euryarchaeota archaeon]
MRKADLVLLHPPSIFDFRERPRLWGPINDLVPSTHIFEMYPLGFVSLASQLGCRGYNVRIINLALKMLRSKKFEVERYLKGLKTEVFGIDLHWLPHVHGSIELARKLKEIHPDVPIIFGGISSTYYYREILEKVDAVDYVLLGDSTEMPMVKLMEELNNGRKFQEVPNLAWRSEGKIKVNPLSYVPEDLRDFKLDYGVLFKASHRFPTLTDPLPYDDFIDHPIMPVIVQKGCRYNCATCGGSRYSYDKFMNRQRVAFRSPEEILDDILTIEEMRSPCFICGDLLGLGRRRMERTLNLIKQERIDVPVIFEMFTPAPRWYFEAISSSVDRFSAEISPESGDEAVRRVQGRKYSDSALYKTINHAFEKGCEKFDVFFMIGLSGETRESLDNTMAMCQRLIDMDKKGRIFPFIAPYAPFLDPGSLAFDYPEHYGFKSHCRSLMDHYNLLDSSVSWKDFLSYETTSFSKDDIVDATYACALRLAEMKGRAGIFDEEQLKTLKHRINISQETMSELERRGDKKGFLDSEAIKDIFTGTDDSVVSDRSELRWLSKPKLLRYLALLKFHVKNL